MSDGRSIEERIAALETIIVGQAELQPPVMTIKQFAQKHTWISLAGLRFLLFQREDNGLQASGAILNIGKKLLIDEAKFMAWVRSQ